MENCFRNILMSTAVQETPLPSLTLCLDLGGASFTARGKQRAPVAQMCLCKWRIYFEETPKPRNADVGSKQCRDASDL